MNIQFHQNELVLISNSDIVDINSSSVQFNYLDALDNVAIALGFFKRFQ